MIRFISTVALILLLLSSCTEKIEVKLDDTYTRLVVFGNITSERKTHFVQLSMTTSYYYDQPAPPVTGATVEIEDDDGSLVTLTETDYGKYATPEDFGAVPGRTYTLRIELQQEINGYKSYLASSYTPRINSIDSIKLRFQPNWGDEGFYEVQCYYQDPLSRDFYVFNLFRNGDLLTDTITKRIVTDDAFYNGSYTNGIGVGYLDQSDSRQKLYPGDTITFQAGSITEDYYTFIWTLQQETGFSTPLFSGPPANLISNVNNGASGFFATYDVAYASVIFQPE